MFWFILFILMVMRKILYISIICLFIMSCSKNGTLDSEYWTAKEAGVYEIISVQEKKYENDNLVSDITTNPPETIYILYTTDGDGFGRPMKIFGDYVPAFLNVTSSSGFAWSVENDNKRLTLGYFDPTIGYIPRASLTVNNIGKTNQLWHYASSYNLNGIEIYTHQIFKVKRRKE